MSMQIVFLSEFLLAQVALIWSGKCVCRFNMAVACADLSKALAALITRKWFGQRMRLSVSGKFLRCRKALSALSASIRPGGFRLFCVDRVGGRRNGATDALLLQVQHGVLSVGSKIIFKVSCFRTKENLCGRTADL